MKFLTAIPVYNEERHVQDVLREVRRYSANILVVNDGSTDRTAELLEQEAGIDVIRHGRNRGYGAALISAFAFALRQEVDVLVTMDCDGQHEPARIPVLLEAIHDADIVSGSRYLRDFRQDTVAPQDRQQINRQITEELNVRFGLNLTDAFCGFKAYRRCALTKLRITEIGESGSVPELAVENPLEASVLLYDGVELVGAKQNRILNVSVLVDKKTTLKIPVSCG